MKYFTFNELCESGTAKTHNIDNTPSEQIKINLRNLVDNCLIFEVQNATIRQGLLLQRTLLLELIRLDFPTVTELQFKVSPSFKHF